MHVLRKCVSTRYFCQHTQLSHASCAIVVLMFKIMML